MSWLRDRARRCGGGERGLTLIELLVASTMSVIIVGAAGSMLISAVQKQPQISERSQDVSTARWVLERMTREIRNGISVEAGSGDSTLTMIAFVRHASCGSDVPLPEEESAIKCKVTYSCDSTACSRAETEPGASGIGTLRSLVDGIEGPAVFNYSPAIEGAEFVGVTLRLPNQGSAPLTISDGATLRGANPFGA